MYFLYYSESIPQSLMPPDLDGAPVGPRVKGGSAQLGGKQVAAIWAPSTLVFTKTQ